MTIDFNHPPLRLLDGMIQWTLERQYNNDFSKHFALKSWLKEFCTIRFCLPRQSGHTTAGIYLAKKYFSSPIFVLPTIRHCKQLECYKNEKTFSSQNFYNNLKGTVKVDCIVFDMSSFVSQTAQDTVYDLDFIENNKRLILFLE